jgi:tetratricopeptide (TPR) repeat protein
VFWLAPDVPAADQPAAQVCIELVRSCDVYVGVLGTRYGSPVRDRPEVSYTELEFNTATDAGLDRLLFMLDTDAADVGIPLSQLLDADFGGRQQAFRRRVCDSGLTRQSFASPDMLGQLVERSLRELADTRRRVGSGLVREQVAAMPQPVRASNSDPTIRLVSVVGRGGIGKTALVCRLLKGLEAGRIPDVEGESGRITVGGIVYLSSNGVHRVEYPNLVADLLRLLPAEAGRRLQGQYQDPHHDPRDLMLSVLDAVPTDQPFVVLLDNLESVMDAERETLTETTLHEALSAVLTAPAHAVTVITTTRVTPTALLTVEPATQRRMRLEKGLGSPDAQAVLRKLDDDGRLGLRDAPEALLDGLRRHTRGSPRALEAVKAILDGDDTLTPRDLLDRTRHLPEDRVVEVLVGEAYQLLDEPATQVMQALAVFPAAVSSVGVDFLLQPVNPTTDGALILARLVRRQLVRFQDGRYYLHPVDRDYARGQIPAGSPGDSPAGFTLAGLRARAADYYAQIRTPRDSWRSLEDVRPQLAEFELRCDTGDFDSAAAVLADIDIDYLQVWGHYRTLLDLHGRIHGRLSTPSTNAVHLGNLGSCHRRLGDYPRAIDLHTQALIIDREIDNREGEAAALTRLGNCHYRLGDYRWAIDLETQALPIAREIGNRQGEATALRNLGLCHAALGDYRQAIDLHTQALGIARDAGDRHGEGAALRNRGNCHAALGDYPQAIDLQTQALGIAREIGDRYGEASALNGLGRAWLTSSDPPQAVILLEQAVRIAEATSDIEPAAEARSGLARAHLLMGDPDAALAAAAAGRKWLYPREQPTLRLLEGLALLELRRIDKAVPAFSDALNTADALLVLADRNMAALQARALAPCGLTTATTDASQARDAARAIVRARAVTDAAGVAPDTQQLLDRIAAHDPAGLLTDVRDAGEA